MPNGEFNPSRNTVLVSATPSPSASRSRVMRLALGTPAPAQLCTFLNTAPLTPLMPAEFGGAFVSATRTSPLGRTWSHRGCSRPLAKALTARSDAGFGRASLGQPFAGAMLTVGMGGGLGAGKVGLAPTAASSGNRALSPQPTSNSANESTNDTLICDVTTPSSERLQAVGDEKQRLRANGVPLRVLSQISPGRNALFREIVECAPRLKGSDAPLSEVAPAGRCPVGVVRQAELSCSHLVGTTEVIIRRKDQVHGDTYERSKRRL